MDPETADILGQPTMPILEQFPEAGSSISVWKWILGLGALCVLYSIVMRIRLQILMWKEKSTKLATRRKYGIPDHDRRPFNVAYTAAILANEEREKEEGKRAFLRQPPVKPVQDAQSLNHRESHADQTFNPATDRYGTSTSLVLPGAYSSTPNPISSPTKPSTSPFNGYPSNKPGYANSFRSRKASGQLYFDQNGNSRHAARNIIDLSSEGDPRKRGYEEQGLDEAELSKKTRIDRDELVDGDEESQWDDFETALSHQRGSKRVFGDEDSGAEGSRDKRARKVSLDKSGRAGYVDEGMDVDDEIYDEVPDLLSPVRGKKRDRAEAGSTFGGDDSDSGQENEKLRQRRRKRRTVAKRKSDTGLLNGHKRDRDMDVDEEMGLPGTPNRRHHKKGKRHSNAHRDGHNSDNSDVSIDDSLASSTRSRHRRIGEVWESNGIRYKIARNGQRLRQALVKRARNKFVMPQDSLHPDKDENLEVYVECWLTEEEYQEAKEKMRLAWQDSPKASAEPENLSVKIPQPKATPTRSVGKDLLWSSTVSTPTHSPATGSPLDSPIDFPLLRPKGLRNPARYSLGSQTGLRNNPFEKQSSITTKRIASASYLNQAIHGGLSDSTNTRPRNLSKWERQEIEAEAITKLRAMKRAEDDAKAREEKEKADKLEKERLERERVLKERLEKERMERERLEKEKQERERKEKEAAAAAAAAAAAPKIPSITVTQPSESSTPAAAPAPSGFSFGTPAAPSTTTAPAPTAPKPTTQALTTAFFAPPSAPKPATTPTATSPSPLFGPAKTDGAAAQPAASSQNLFSFKTPGAPASATTPTATSSPFSFGVSASTANATGTPPTTSVFGQPSATASQPSATEEKKSGFSFGVPATTGSVFGSNPSQPAATTAAAPASTTASTGTKFNFFGGSNTGGDAKAAATQQPAAPTGGAFSFGNPAATATPAAGPAKNGAAPTATTSTTSKFSFGVPASTTTAIPTFGSTTSTASPFGVAPSTSTNGATTSAFGQTPSSLSSAFGPAKATTTGATSSIFGAPSTATNGAAATSSTAPGKPSFSFATTGGDKGKTQETPTSNKPPATFGGFGGGASVTNGATSVFGAGAGTPVFGKPAESSSTPTTTAPGKFSFGTPAAAGNSSATTPVTETPKTFSFAPGAATTTTTTPAGTPATGGGFSFSFAAKTPAAAGATGGSVFGGAPGQPSTPAAFGFGAPTAGSTTPAGAPPASGFTFGK